jgi:hypothetical protein
MHSRHRRSLTLAIIPPKEILVCLLHQVRPEFESQRQAMRSLWKRKLDCSLNAHQAEAG